jgi:hypothetical protein
MIEFLVFINSLLDQLTELIPKAIALSAVLAAVIPQTGMLSTIIHKLGFNFGTATNK